MFKTKPKGLKAAKQIHNKKGPYYEKWRKRWMQATGLKLKEKD